MSKIDKRNYVKKNMDKMHKPKTEASCKLYDRKNDRIVISEDMVEGVRFLLSPDLTTPEEHDEDRLNYEEYLDFMDDIELEDHMYYNNNMENYDE